MKKRVLVVEDEIDIQEVVKVLLESSDYEVIRAENGKIALEQIENGVHPDVLLLDLNMPKMSGYHLLGELQSRGLHNNFSIIVMSADNFTKQHMDRLGIKNFISKPFELDDLQRAVDISSHSA